MPNSHNILITRSLNEEQQRLAESLGLNIVEEPAISIKFRDNWLSFESILNKTAQPVFVFTSQNGVEGFERFRKAGMEIDNEVPVYAVGSTTERALTATGFKKVKTPKQQDGVGLSRIIINDILQTPELKNATVLHFCGDRRRDELRHYLTQSEIDVKDIVVYKTELNEMNLPGNNFDAILFYSPSAVQAFRNSGGFQKIGNPELFAIGNTTAEELSIESGKHVHISPEPDTDVFLKYVARVLGGEEKVPLLSRQQSGEQGDD